MQQFLMLSPTVIVLLILCSDQFQISLAYKYEYGDGSYYVGSRDAQGRPNGPGRFHNSSGDLEYKGQFEGGKRHGQGTLYHPDGSVFQGLFVFGQVNGKGILTLPNGDKISGEFRQGCPDGNIELILSNRDHTIRGQFRHGMAHGKIGVYQDQKIVIERLYRMGKPLRVDKFKMEEVPDNLQFSCV